MEDEVAKKTSWTAIVLTCQNKKSAHAFQRELEIHRSKGFISKDVLILNLEDPKGGVGSGGATLNAVLVVTEHLSAKAGFQGRDFPFSPCGRFFNTLPAKHAIHADESKENLCDGLVSNFDYVLNILSETLSINAPPGVWICSADMIPSVAPDSRIDWKKYSDGITMILSQENVHYAKDHGVVKLGEESEVKDIIFREIEEEIKSCALNNGKVPVVSGVVYMNTKVASKILSLHVYHPLDACTYYGLDNGAEPIQLSMIFDILLCLAEDVTESDFVCGERSGSYGRSSRPGTNRDSQRNTMLMKSARAMLWKSLRGVQLKGVVIENGKFDYMKPSAECYRRQMLNSIKLLNFSGVSFDCNRRMHVSLCKNGSLSDHDGPNMDDSSVVVNSIVEDGIKIGINSVISHCHLKGQITFGSGSILMGLSANDMEDLPSGLSFPNDLCAMYFNVSLPRLGVKPKRVPVVFGVHDDLQVRHLLLRE
ncbi:hypothetical protein OS493_035627 [Desmophyllum pertusum]|uniref:GDP-fucose pyrophosphorylase domain-containing protein n=1 Tax=Desmophyllum pertusum TaxID=174260 RepID=A0A9X0D0J7_9CNID|nr:hypothetical protein OS493_035627 [Desmophyllum pertusum]